MKVLVVVTLQWDVQDRRQKYVLNREVLIILINSVSYVFLLTSMLCSVFSLPTGILRLP